MFHCTLQHMLRNNIVCCRPKSTTSWWKAVIVYFCEQIAFIDDKAGFTFTTYSAPHKMRHTLPGSYRYSVLKSYISALNHECELGREECLGILLHGKQIWTLSLQPLESGVMFMMIKGHYHCNVTCLDAKEVFKLILGYVSVVSHMQFCEVVNLLVMCNLSKLN